MEKTKYRSLFIFNIITAVTVLLSITALILRNFGIVVYTEHFDNADLFGLTLGILCLSLVTLPVRIYARYFRGTGSSKLPVIICTVIAAVIAFSAAVLFSPMHYDSVKSPDGRHRIVMEYRIANDGVTITKAYYEHKLIFYTEYEELNSIYDVNVDWQSDKAVITPKRSDGKFKRAEVKF